MAMTDAIPASSRREQAKGGRRARIVDATYALLREVGISDLSVKMIADQAGVSPATVYNLFGAKAAVLENVYERDLAEFEKRVDEAPSADSLERIFDAVAIAAGFYRSDPRFYRSVMSMPNSNAADAALIARINRSRAGVWVEMVRTAAEDGHLRADTDARWVGASMRLLAGGALSAWLGGLISIDRYEADVTYGFAAVLWSFATPASQKRLRAKLDTPLDGHDHRPPG